MKRSVHRLSAKHAHDHISIPGLLMTRGFNATLAFFCTLCICSLD
ncbi:MAG: hypothetical protein PHH36_09370 [Sideroxydans sp.]|nr:hypothetical protein [Sideroxydans sp.]